MNKIIESYVRQTYGFDVNNANEEDLKKVTEILVRDKTMSDENSIWDFSAFPNLIKIDCSYNPIKTLNIASNKLLEEISIMGSRGDIHEKLDFSGNPHLKRVQAGQDGLIELDFSSNIELEDLSIMLESSLRWLDIAQCTNLKSIFMQGVNIPFVDLTQCLNLESVDINYWNLYRKKDDVFGPGFPRPFVFVADSFDENKIYAHTRDYEYYTYYLIRVREGSAEDRFLKYVKSIKQQLLSIPNDYSGHGVAKMHYRLLSIYQEMQHSNN